MLMIIPSLYEIHKKHRLKEGDVSSHTKSAQRITKEWQEAVCHGCIEAEVKVSPENNERIDIVNHQERIAYELKVSGKNTHHELYKDLIKILTYNEYQQETTKIQKLVFISESKGINSLSGRLDSKFINMLLSTHDLTIELVSI